MRLTARKGQIGAEGGFMLPVAILALLLMSIVALVSLTMASDEFQASRAMLGGGLAFYAAEAGLHEVYATWDDTRQAAVDALAAGDSLDLGWQTLGNRGSYRAVINRWDDGAQPLYQLVTEGRVQGRTPSQATLSFLLTAGPGGLGQGYKLGECCDGAGTVRGEVIVDGSGTAVDGHDEVPAGWGDPGVCPDSLYDKPGIRMEDTSLLTEDPDAVLTGVPPVVQDPGINDATFSQFGPDLTWDEIKAMADFTWGSHGGSLELVNQIRPSYNADGTCNTTDPYNWGSNNPADPCFDFFPIILIRGDFSIEASYGQAVFILDYDDSVSPKRGAEFDLDDDADLNGIILGKGCVELKDRGAFHGAIFVDGSYINSMCPPDVTLEVKRDAQLDYSQCAIDRAIVNAGLVGYAEPTIGGGPGGVELFANRSFNQVYR